jgi:HCOMODA/2-hydroxy-3-carboxy-muconic semialdehyde decarboxylase
VDVLAAARAGVWIAAAAMIAAGLPSRSFGQQADDPRETLVLANRILAMEGLVGPYGHVSARSGADRFWIADHRSPDSVELSHLKAVAVGLDEAAAKSQHWYREIFIHSEIYRLLPEIGAVVHVHAPHSVALGTLAGSDRIRPTTNPGANLGEYVPIYSQTGLVETPDNARKVASALQGQNGVLLRGHGAVIVGETLPQAVLRAIYLELEAQYQLMARAAGTPLFYSPEETARFRRTTAVEHAWEFYVQKLRRASTDNPGSHRN